MRIYDEFMMNLCTRTL